MSRAAFFVTFLKHFPFDNEKLNSNYFESHKQALKCLIHKSGNLNNKGLIKAINEFLAHLSRRLTGELIVYQSSRYPCVRACVGASVRSHFQT